MTRNIRLIVPNIFHHAIQRGNNRQTVFQEKEDRFFYLKWARELGIQFHTPIFGYCLMTNHNHLLILPSSEEGMINFMKLLAQRYTQYYNRKYQRSGKLWENRYKIHPFDPEVYYIVLRYIEMNPVRAGMVKDGTRYPWSSATYHLLGKKNETVMADYHPNFTCNYKDFFYEQERKEDLEAIQNAAQQGKAWGKATFLEELTSKLGKVVVPRKKGRPKTDK